MRAALWIGVGVACLAAGIVLGRSDDKKTAVIPRVDSSIITPPDSLAGRKVRVYFRGVDDISAPIPRKTRVSLAAKLTYLSGIVSRVEPGWVELSDPENPRAISAWVPASSIAMVLQDDDEPPTTQP